MWTWISRQTSGQCFDAQKSYKTFGMNSKVVGPVESSAFSASAKWEKENKKATKRAIDIMNAKQSWRWVMLFGWLCVCTLCSDFKS